MVYAVASIRNYDDEAAMDESQMKIERTQRIVHV